MRQKWRSLLFLHWEVDPDLIRPLIPAELELDLFKDAAYIGLVPFTMTGVRPIGFPAVPGLSSFHETNVRTYVHRGGRDPGVWFFSLDAANLLAVRLARRLFHLPYHHARMFLEVEKTGYTPATASILYAGGRLRPEPLPASYLIRASITGRIEPARPGSLEHFLIERYVLYARRNDRLLQGQVYHGPYPLQPAHIHTLDESLLAAAGLVRPSQVPLAHYADGVDVEIFRLLEVRHNSL